MMHCNVFSFLFFTPLICIFASYNFAVFTNDTGEIDRTPHPHVLFFTPNEKDGDEETPIVAISENPIVVDTKYKLIFSKSPVLLIVSSDAYNSEQSGLFNFKSVSHHLVLRISDVLPDYMRRKFSVKNASSEILSCLPLSGSLYVGIAEAIKEETNYWEPMVIHQPTQSYDLVLQSEENEVTNYSKFKRNTIISTQTQKRHQKLIKEYMTDGPSLSSKGTILMLPAMFRRCADEAKNSPF